MFTSQRSEHKYEAELPEKDPKIRKKVSEYLAKEALLLKTQDDELLLAIEKLSTNIKRVKIEMQKPYQHNTTQINERSAATWLTILQGNGTREKYISTDDHLDEQKRQLREAKLTEFNKTNTVELANKINKLHSEHDIDT